MNVHRPAAAAAALLLGAVAVSGCSILNPQPPPGENTNPAPQANAQPPAAAAPPAAGAAPAAGAPAQNPRGGYWPTQVFVSSNTRLGDILVDGQGFALYRFDNDSSQPSRSTCLDACAVRFLPVLTRGTISFSGIDDLSVLGTVSRPDGTVQLTFRGWPLYRYCSDAPGQFNGHGLDGTWSVISSTGDKASA